MFDDLNEEKKEAPQAGDILKQDERPVAEDIFSDSKTEPGTPGAMVSDNINHRIDDLGIDSMEIEQQNKRKLVILFLMFIGLIAIGWGTYFAFGKIVKKIGMMDNAKNEISTPVSDVSDIVQNEKKDIDEAIDESSNANVDNQADDTTGTVVDIEEEEELITDSDKDGLTDEEELELGLNIESVDTDSDGLFDWEEVKIYKTDPLNPDTDNDGFTDGDEVKAGYNPKGAGKLLNINNIQN